MARSSTHARDAGLRKVRSTTKWIAGGAAGLVAVFTAFTLPRAKHASATTTGGTQSSVGSGDASSGVGSGQGQSTDPGLQSPDQAPSQTFQPPVAQSGGS